MNSYIKSQPTDENNKNEYIEFSNKCCIGCIPSYTYVYCVYINKEYVAPEQHNIQSLFKTPSDMYITSLSKLMDESLQDLPKLFVHEIIKERMF